MLDFHKIQKQAEQISYGIEYIGGKVEELAAHPPTKRSSRRFFKVAASGLYDVPGWGRPEDIKEKLGDEYKRLITPVWQQRVILLANLFNVATVMKDLDTVTLKKSCDEHWKTRPFSMTWTRDDLITRNDQTHMENLSHLIETTSEEIKGRLQEMHDYGVEVLEPDAENNVFVAQAQGQISFDMDAATHWRLLNEVQHRFAESCLKLAGLCDDNIRIDLGFFAHYNKTGAQNVNEMWKDTLEDVSHIIARAKYYEQAGQNILQSYAPGRIAAMDPLHGCPTPQ
ncbi:MAG: hypothetical protein DI551_11825 [Micavibrio aeruginosavorus]|uniref:Uncharacterized protein n=1 Tax=Micavibrio aeruginosavorus TaxID=349221 RepID=A0A2W5PM17_9BACT|nr:MAG: hypothetical protein DI551_11825 [Micavibrio aeruginosavorus]